MYISCRDKNILLVWYIEISFYTVERSQIARAAIAPREIFPVLETGIFRN
jgi:spore maturation protein CgeB